MNENKNGQSNGVMGAAILGAVVGASAVVMFSKDLRKNLKSFLMDSLEKSDGKLDEISQKAGSIKKQAVKVTARKLDNARRKLEESVSS
jgi:hypothetical protein